MEVDIEPKLIAINSWEHVKIFVKATSSRLKNVRVKIESDSMSVGSRDDSEEKTVRKGECWGISVKLKTSEPREHKINVHVAYTDMSPQARRRTVIKTVAIEAGKNHFVPTIPTPNNHSVPPSQPVVPKLEHIVDELTDETNVERVYTTKFTNVDAQRLHNCIIRLYDENGFKRFLYFELNEELGLIAGKGNFKEIMFDVIREAQQKEWVFKLMDKVYRANPRNRDLVKLRQELWERG